MLLKRIQLGLIHVAVAMTLVPINSTLNRVMIKELALSATLVAILASLPYLFSPMQIAIGSFSDHHPLLGYRRTPYIIAGLVLCALGVALSPAAVLLLPAQFGIGLGLCILTFGAWGMGFNFATVSYFSLASEISGDKERTRTISTMFFIMIAGIIATAIGLSRLLEPYSPGRLASAFQTIALIALALGTIGLLGLEERAFKYSAGSGKRPSEGSLMRTLGDNRQVKLFFAYLVLLLAAILGQDILLEPFAGEAFQLPVQATTRITSIWGVCVLAALIIAGILEGRLAKRSVAKIGAWGAILAFSLIALSGVVNSQAIFYTGVVLLGLATGLATVSNLSLMLDMTVAGKVGLFIGAWGMANALARLIGSILSGFARDLITFLANDPLYGYVLVFLLEAAMLVLSLLILRTIDVGAFRRLSSDHSVIERAAIAGDL
jgi:BCD family chlorophyll transporter-like MFS transporter